MSGSRIGRRLLEFLPAFVVAVVILPYLIQTGTAVPWHPATIDLDVYRAAVKDFIHGTSIYDTATPGWNLKWIYPPIAAVLMLPMVFGPLWLWQLVWVGLLVGAQQSVLRRCGIPRGWTLGLLGAVLIACCEPLRTSLGYGQVNTVLMALVVADLLPASAGERRRIPRGVLLGLAAAIKLTPLLFVVFAFFIGRRRLGVVGLLSFVGWNLVGAVIMPTQTVRYFAGLAHGQTNTTSPVYVGNQSMLGAVTRFGGTSVPVVLLGLALGMAVAGVGTLAAAYWWRHGAPVLAVALCGLCTNIASPLSWTHHHVWAIVLLAAVLVREPLPSWLRYAAAAWVGWLCAALALAVLPYGNCIECHYHPFQHLIAEASPLGGSALIVAVAAVALARLRRGALTAA